MRKREELTSGCMARAGDDEMTFVLLGRDAAAPAAIRAWIAERVRLGRNRVGDPQLVEAERCAMAMEAERAASGGAVVAPPGEPESRGRPWAPTPHEEERDGPWSDYSAWCRWVQLATEAEAPNGALYDPSSDDVEVAIGLYVLMCKLADGDPIRTAPAPELPAAAESEAPA